MTPSLAVQENDGDINAIEIQGLGLGTARDPDEERRKHIGEVVQLLRARISGRGVSREAIERLGQLEGFESIWQEDSLSIAGNSVDLEIEFYPGEDSVKDVSLSYATPEAQETQRRDEATAVLKRDLIPTPEERERRIWKSLKGFHANLERLAKLDKLSQEVNCFEAVEGLYESLQKVWDAENKRGTYRGTFDHLCWGWIGRPSLHKGNRVGMGVEYWVENHRLLDAKQTNQGSEDMAVDQSQGDFEKHMDEQPLLHSVTIECEAGFPSLRLSKDWVGSEVLTAVNTNAPSSNGASDSAITLVDTLVDWIEPPPTLVSSVNSNQADPMAVDSGMVGSGTPHRRFVAKLARPVDVPFLAASDLYRHLNMQVPAEFRTVVYDSLLVPGWTGTINENGTPAADPSIATRRRRRRSFVAFTAEKQPIQKHHTYTFQAFEPVAGRTIRDFPFSHPRQLADVFPILRQYTRLASLIQKVFPSEKVDDRTGTHHSKPRAAAGANPNGFSNLSTQASHITVLSNDDPDEEVLDFLLDAPVDHNVSKDPWGGTDDRDRFRDVLDNDIKVDITLRTQIGQAPLLMLLVTVPDAAAWTSEAPSISIHFEVRLNGHIHVTHVAGLGTPADDVQETQKMHKKLGRALDATEDLSLVVEWVLDQLPGEGRA
jgi:hypothetical protein